MDSGLFWTPFGLEDDDQEQPGYYTPPPRHQNAPVIPNTSYIGSHHESYAFSSFSSGEFSRAGNVYPGPPPPLLAGGTWSGNQYFDDFHARSFRIPGGNASASDMNLFRTQMEPPLIERAISIPSGILPTSHIPPALHAPNPWQSTSWYHPVQVAREDGEGARPLSSPGMIPEASPVHLAHTERILPLIDPTPSPSSVQFASRNDPVPDFATSPPRGERWASWNEPTFQCMWITDGVQCPARVRGDRKSVTAHLRDKHDFTRDGQSVGCAWAGCAKPVQRRNIPRHIITCHLGIKVPCSVCGLPLSRADANKKHQQACTGAKLFDGDDGYF